jgi:hypothetical protein
MYLCCFRHVGVLALDFLEVAVPSGLFRQSATAEKKQNITRRKVWVPNSPDTAQEISIENLTQRKIDMNTNENDDEVDSAKGTSKRLKTFCRDRYNQRMPPVLL